MIWIGKGKKPIRSPRTFEDVNSLSKDELKILRNTPPVRMVVGIEGDNTERRSLGDL